MINIILTVLLVVCIVAIVLQTIVIRKAKEVNNKFYAENVKLGEKNKKLASTLNEALKVINLLKEKGAIKDSSEEEK